ncbi:lys-63-specific deubiquitinase BRCC36-like [Dipodomys merriami]|uniref:lys-63-specific deubiquitinase BRCC36-like n=1 Tax=Dipodomys merriami TaxID=94247 RepID=UPI003855D1FA
MAVQAVHLDSDVFLVCVNHALSTDKEEVMGLCIGVLKEEEGSHTRCGGSGEDLGTVAAQAQAARIVHIRSVIILPRSDKRKDRVEISPEQLSAASAETERLAALTGSPLRVVGWYHSHPHITVWPSHVDIRTQAAYQMMDPGFVGIIFSCFVEDKNTNTGQIAYTCFQSARAPRSAEYERVDVPLHVVPRASIGKACLQSLVELPKILWQEELASYRRMCGRPDQDPVARIRNASAYVDHVCSQVSAISDPLLQWLENRVEQNQEFLQELTQEKKELMEKLSSLK